MFLGAQYPRLDEKNRLILPAKFRDELSEGLVLTKGQDRCLVVWPKAAFEEYAQRLRAGSQTWWRQHSRLASHDFAQDWLWLDIDLTPLPASKHAEASTKGKLAKKGAMDANSLVSRPHSTTKRSSRSSILVIRRVRPPTRRWWRRSRGS